MQTPRWITWNANGYQHVWHREPEYDDGYWVSEDGCADEFGTYVRDRKYTERQPGGPKAIRRIRLEKV